MHQAASLQHAFHKLQVKQSLLSQRAQTALFPTWLPKLWLMHDSPRERTMYGRLNTVFNIAVQGVSNSQQRRVCFAGLQERRPHVFAIGDKDHKRLAACNNSVRYVTCTPQISGNRLCVCEGKRKTGTSRTPCCWNRGSRTLGHALIIPATPLVS